MLERNDMIVRGGGADGYMHGSGAMMPYSPRGPMMPPAAMLDEQEPNIFASIFRHAWIVILMLAVALGGACVYLKKTDPLYKSVSKIYIEPLRNGPAELATQERGNYLYTQRDFIKSTPILSQLIERPEVKKLPIFGQLPNPMMYLRLHVDADVGRQNDIIEVSVESADPEESARLVNSLVETFIADRQKRAETTTSTVLQSLLAAQKEQEQELASVRSQREKILASDPNLRLRGAGGESPVLQRVLVWSQQLSTLNMQITQQEGTYGPNSRQLTELRRQAEVADKQYRDAKKEALETVDKQGKVDALTLIEQETKASLEPLRRRIVEIQQDEDRRKQITPVTVMELGEPEYKPSFPKKTNVLALAGVVGLLLGSTLALVRDKMDNRLRTIEEVQGIVNLPILGVVPRMPGRRTAVARAMAVHLDPRSEVAEAYRTIRTAVYFTGAGLGNRAKTLLLTSPEPGDGKTTSASNLAIAIAQTGRNILLLDADFRKPTQHKNLDVKDTVGLSSVLAGIETIDRAIQRTGVEGLDILPCGPIPENPSEILNSQEFGELIDRLAMKYDHILFDSPPCNLVTDARILGAVCDATILVLRAEKSTRKSAEHARNALLSVGANVLGVIVNDTPRGKGYEVYGGQYYGTPEMRTAPSAASRGASNGDHNGNGKQARLPKPASRDTE